jgi:serine protease DegQ
MGPLFLLGLTRRVPQRVTAAVIAAVLAAAVAGCSGEGVRSESGTGAGVTSPAATAAAPPTGAGSTVGGIPAVVRSVEPSVVTIFRGDGVGSGVVFRDDGTIVTNEHVVRGARTVEISFADGRRVTGTVLATDVATDLAVVRADRSGLPAARFREQLPQVGEQAIAIGSPLGLQQTVTAGIVSGLHRVIPADGERGQPLVDLLQTDAPISPGNSGGALVDGSGQVMGINDAYLPPATGAVSIGFAIPSATVLDVVDQLLSTGRARHAFFGIQPGTLTAEIAERLGVSRTDGVLVLDVVGGGPADRAGIRPGDVLIALDDTAVPSVEEFLAALRGHRPGDRVRVTVLRGDTERQLTVVLVDRPS